MQVSEQVKQILYDKLKEMANKHFSSDEANAYVANCNAMNEIAKTIINAELIEECANDIKL